MIAWACGAIVDGALGSAGDAGALTIGPGGLVEISADDVGKGHLTGDVVAVAIDENLDAAELEVGRSNGVRSGFNGRLDGE